MSLMRKRPYRTGDRVEYIGWPHVVGTIVAVHPGVNPYEIAWDNPMVLNVRLGRGGFRRAVGDDQHAAAQQPSRGDGSARARGGAG